MGNLPNIKGLTDSQISAFHKKIKKVENGCWLWIGTCQKIGYGKVSINGKTCLAHRVAYELYKGEIPENLKLDHFYCKTRNCVNPEHVEPVTQAENVRRGQSFSSKNAQKTHCPKGHAYDEKNTRLETLKTGTVVRHCRKCGIESVAKKKKEKLDEWYRNLREEFNMPETWPFVT